MALAGAAGRTAGRTVGLLIRVGAGRRTRGRTAPGGSQTGIQQRAAGHTVASVAAAHQHLQVAGLDVAEVGVEALIEHLQQLIHRRQHHGNPRVIRIFPGHTDKVYVLLGVHTGCQLSKGQNVAQGQIGGDVLHKDLGQSGSLQQGGGLEALGGHRLQEGLLGLNPAQVPVGVLYGEIVVVAPADQAHGLFAVELLIALFQVDVQVLTRGGIVIVHIKGDIKVHAAQGLHHLAYRIPLHHYVEVGDDAGELAHLFLQGGDSLFYLGVRVGPLVVVIYRIEPVTAAFPVHVDHGVPGQAHAVNGLVLGIKGDEDHGVGVAAAAGILAYQQEGVDPILSAALGHIGQLGSVIAGVLVPFGGQIRNIRQLHPRLQAHGRSHPDHGQHDQDLKQAVADLLSPAHPGHPGFMPAPPTAASGGASSSCCAFSLSAHTFLIS